MGDIVVPAVILLGLVALLVIVGYCIRRWVHRDEPVRRPLWTLHELTRLRDAGELTIPQYEKLKAQALEECGPRQDRQRTDRGRGRSGAGQDPVGG